MKRFILIPDSFKGSMSSIEICDLMGLAIKNIEPHSKIVRIPVADGGEGTVDAFLTALGGKKVFTSAKDPYYNEIRTFYGILPDKTAVIEMSAAAGLPLVRECRDVENRTTFGVGTLIADALKCGCRKIILGLGGSATNDGGCGAAAALGVKFLSKDGEEFVPVGASLKDIASIDMSEKNSLLKNAEITVMCDVDCPMCGKKGAAYVFAPQKGADEETVRSLDDGLRHLAEIIYRDVGLDVQSMPGAGAAGGMGGGAVAFFNGRLQSGIKTLLEYVRFTELLANSDLVFTGEGRLDQQSLYGKVISGVSNEAKKAKVPVIAVVGDIGDSTQDIYKLGVTAVFSINRMAMPFSESKKRCREDLKLTMENILRILKI